MGDMDAVKCTGANCPVCSGIGKAASGDAVSSGQGLKSKMEAFQAGLPSTTATFGISVPGVPKTSQSSGDLKTEEKLAERIVALCRDFGVTGMSRFAAQAVAKELIASEKQQYPLVQMAQAAEKATTALQDFNNLNFPVPDTGVLICNPHKTTSEATIFANAVMISTSLKVDNSKPLYQWEPEARAALEKVALAQKLILVSRACLVKAQMTGQVKAIGWAIPEIQHVGPPSAPENHGPIGDWKKYGISVKVGPKPEDTGGE